MTRPEPEAAVIVVRVVVDAPDRAAVDYLAADGRWTCSEHLGAGNCPHLLALQQLITAAVLSRSNRRRPASRPETKGGRP